MKFEDVIGKKFGFYGVCGNTFKIGCYVFEAIEDESDGYRSYLDSVEIKSSKDLIFFNKPIADVIVKAFDIDSYGLVDAKDGHVWLEFGTDKCDEYYPQFVFRYSIK